MADYIRKDAIGKANALIGFAFLVGEILSMGVLFNVTKSMSAEVGFSLVAIVGSGLSTIFLCLIKEPQLRNKANENGQDTPQIDSVDAEEDMPPRCTTEDGLTSSAEMLTVSLQNESSGPSERSISEEEFKRLPFKGKLREVNR